MRNTRATPKPIDAAAGQQQPVAPVHGFAARVAGRCHRHIAAEPAIAEGEREDRDQDARGVAHGNPPLVAAHRAAGQDHLVEAAGRGAEIGGDRVVACEAAVEQPDAPPSRSPHRARARRSCRARVAMPCTTSGVKALPSITPRIVMNDQAQARHQRHPHAGDRGDGGRRHRAQHPGQRQVEQIEQRPARDADRQRHQLGAGQGAAACMRPKSSR